MARKPNTTSAVGVAPESVVAQALRTSANAQRASADMLDALAAMYDDAGAAGPAGAPTSTASSGNASSGQTSVQAGPPSLDTVKDALMKLVDQDGGKRLRVDPIIIRHAGALMSVKDIPPDRLAGVLADAQAELAKGPATAIALEL